MKQAIQLITEVSHQDKNALVNLNYQKLLCEIDFKDLLVAKPWGEEYLLFENEFCAIWILHINYMENTSMHCHPQKETSLVCVDGKVSCNTLNDNYEINTLDGIFFTKGVFHQTQSISKNGSYVLEIETPVNKFDLVRINDTYGRQGKEYEDKQHYKHQKNLTLNHSDNNHININTTRVEILNISSQYDLDKYSKDSLVAVLSKDKNMGKISRLKDVELPKNTTIVLISNIEDTK